LNQFSKSLWQPSYNSTCKKEDISKECAAYAQRLEKQNKNWRSYLKVCEQTNTKLQHGLSCLNGLAELKNFLIENATQQALINAENKNCSENKDNKLAILLAYNSRSPELLKFQDKKATENLLKRSCLEIKNFVLGYQKNIMQKLTLTLPQSHAEQTPQQQEYVNWQEQFIKPYKPSEPFWKEIESIVKEKIQDSQCMSNYRLFETTCRIGLSFIFNTTFSRVGQVVINEVRIAKLVEQELELEKAAQIKFRKDQSLANYAHDLAEQRASPSTTLQMADNWSDASSAMAEHGRADYIRKKFAASTALEDPVKYNATPLSEGQKKLISKIDSIQKTMDQQFYRKLQGRDVIGFNSKGKIPGKLVKYDDDAVYVEAKNPATNKLETYKLNYNDFTVVPQSEYSKVVMP